MRHGACAVSVSCRLKRQFVAGRRARRRTWAGTDRRTPQPQLIGPHRGGGGAIGEQVELVFPDSVLHLARPPVDHLIQALSVDRCQR